MADENEHILASVMLIYWDGNEMKIVEPSIDMDMNVVGKIRSPVMG